MVFSFFVFFFFFFNDTATTEIYTLSLHDALPIDGHLRHPAPRRELPAGDRDHPAGGLVELGLARDVDGLLRVPGGDERPHARVGARDVARCERAAEERVDRLEQIRDVALSGLDVLQL